MPTKADLMAAIERVNLALQDAAKVVSALPNDTTAPPASGDLVSVRTDESSKQFSVKSTPGIDTVKWVLADGTTGRWYGPISAMPVTGEYGPWVIPAYAKPGDRVLVLWGGADSMKNTIKVPPYTVAAPANPTPPTNPTNPTVPATPSGDARYKFVAGMTVGTNQERLNMVGMMYDAVSVRRDRAYYDYLNGFSDHDRYFSPVNFTMDRGCGTSVPGLWACDQLLDCAQQSMLAGRRAIYSPLDVVDKAEFARWSDIKTWFTQCCKRVQERALDPDKFAFELANEWATDDVDLFNERSNELYTIARQYLPNHRLVVGGPEWNGWKRFDDRWKPPMDRDYIIQFHHYEFRSVGGWIEVQDRLQAFGKKHGVPVINGELNIDFGRMKQKDHATIWADNFVNFCSTGRRVPVNPWAFIGSKQDFRLNVSATDPRAIPLMEQTFKKCQQLMTA